MVSNITDDEASSLRTSDLLPQFPEMNMIPQNEGGSASVQHISEEVNSVSEQTQDDSDPLGISQLSLAFNYTLYKIQDTLQSLTLQTEEYLVHQFSLFNQDLSNIDLGMEELKIAARKCADLKMRFHTIEQIGMIVHEFKSRIEILEHKLFELKSRKNANPKSKNILRGG